MTLAAHNWDRFFLEITNRCDFDCRFCASGISQRSRSDLDPSLALSVIDQLRDLDFAETIYFHVLGEPLLHPEVLPIVNHAAEAGLRPVLFTNGGALTRHVIAGVLASKADELLISMQTITRKAYEEVRRTPIAWEEYLGGIQQAVASAAERPFDGGPAVRVSVGIRKPDPEHPEDLYFTDYGSADEARAAVASIFALLPRADLSGVYQALAADAPANAGPMPVADRVQVNIRQIGNWRRMWRQQASDAGSCRWFGEELAVLSNGAITFCHLDYDGRTTVGNVTEDRLAEVVRDSGFAALSEAFIAGRAVPPACRYCRGVRQDN
jgi:MoaA/NifB/PqqE/SkfB family radical SAM enzyme